MHQNKNVYHALGIMSGTSLDGLDIASCRFEFLRNKWSFELLDATCVRYDSEMKHLLKSAFSASAAEMVSLDAILGKFIGEQIMEFIRNFKTKPELIASHGHTVFHRPDLGYTTQIGSGAHISATTGITTVCNFRELDVALGGQGAPLVPIGDRLLFAEYRACLNLGGFANISYETGGKVQAFDICPVNFVLNRLANKLNLEFDEDGKIASGGCLDMNLLNELNNLSFYSKTGSKSLGQEWVDKEILPMLPNYSQLSIPDLMNTYTQHIAMQLASVLKNTGIEKVLITGGGAYNKYLIECIRRYSATEITIPSKQIIEFKEAIIFALLGILRLRGEINTLSSVTGAKCDSCGGIIYHIKKAGQLSVLLP